MGKECYHCHQWVEDKEPHDCWTTTERALTAELSEDLMDAWERLRESASEFGEQRIYASHNSIMFSRKVCYFFVLPKKKILEVWFFLGRTLKAPMVRKTVKSSKLKVAHLVPRHSPRPGRAASDRLAPRSLRDFRTLKLETRS